MLPTETLRTMGLKCERFEFCPEVVAKLCRLGMPIREVPISYRPRSHAEGKKLGLRDGWSAVRTLLRYRHWVPPRSAPGRVVDELASGEPVPGRQGESGDPAPGNSLASVRRPLEKPCSGRADQAVPEAGRSAPPAGYVARLRSRRLPPPLVTIGLVGLAGLVGPLSTSGCSGDAVQAQQRLEAAIDEVRGGRSSEIDVREMGPLPREAIAKIATVPGLRSLNLDRSQVDDLTLRQILGGQPLLRELSVSKTETTDGSLSEIAQLDQLEFLRLDQTLVTDAGLEALAADADSLSRLSNVSLWRTYVTDSGAAALGKLSSLRTLSLDETRVGDASLQTLAGVTTLRELRVGGTGVTPSGVASFRAKRPEVRLFHDLPEATPPSAPPAAR